MGYAIFLIPSIFKYSISSEQYLGEIILFFNIEINHLNSVVNVNNVSGCIVDGTCSLFTLDDNSRLHKYIDNFDY